MSGPAALERGATVQRAARALVWLWHLTKAWLPQTLGVAATGFSIIWGSYGARIWTDGTWALVLATVFLLLALVAQAALQRPSYMALAKQKEEAVLTSAAKSKAIEQAFNVLLRKIAEYCGVAANSDRVSVYYFHEDQFVMLARWALHPKYSQPGRRSYPIGQGAIGEAWDAGSVVINLPSTRARWEQRLTSNHGFSAEDAKKLAMQCQSIAALRIEADHRAVGVIVFESLDLARAAQSTLDTVADSMLYATLGELVGAVATLTPSVEKVVQEAADKKAAIQQPNWKPVSSASGSLIPR